jgi:hypothetical protein
LGIEIDTVSFVTATKVILTSYFATMTFTRKSGTSGNIIGKWISTDDSTGNSLEVTFNADKTVSFVGNIYECEDRGDGKESSEEYSVWTGESRVMNWAGTTLNMVLHIHAWAPENTIPQVAVSGPSLNSTFDEPGTEIKNDVIVDDFSSDNIITITPQVGDTYTFTVTKKDSTTFTRTQSLTQVLLDAPLITSPTGHDISDALLGQTLNLTWTIPSGIQIDDIIIQGKVCKSYSSEDCSNVDGIVTSATTGTIELPMLTDPTSASVDVRIHHGVDVFMNCLYEFHILPQ